VTPEVEQLVVGLDGLRVGVLGKLAELDKADAQRSAVAAGRRLTAWSEVIAVLADAEVVPATRDGKAWNLRWAILSGMAETTRHAGHVAIIREQSDRQTGR
jgi:hypothetical protein